MFHLLTYYISVTENIWTYSTYQMNLLQRRRRTCVTSLTVRMRWFHGPRTSPLLSLKRFPVAKNCSARVTCSSTGMAWLLRVGRLRSSCNRALGNSIPSRLNEYCHCSSSSLCTLSGVYGHGTLTVCADTLCW